MAGDPKGFAALSDHSAAFAAMAQNGARFRQVQPNLAAFKDAATQGQRPGDGDQPVGVRSVGERFQGDGAVEFGGGLAALAEPIARSSALAANRASFANLQLAAGLMAQEPVGASPILPRSRARFPRRHRAAAQLGANLNSAGALNGAAISAVGLMPRRLPASPEPRGRLRRWLAIRRALRRSSDHSAAFAAMAAERRCIRQVCSELRSVQGCGAAGQCPGDGRPNRRRSAACR